MEKKKYKMIIIDDEYLVRLGIKETIDWDALNIEIVAEGKNGKQGLELIKEHHPDVVISDIKMPVMDGLDLVKAVKEEQIDTCLIMLSGYKDFEYAKEALENGAYLYLLKPIDNQKLIDAVIKGIAKLELDRQNTKKLNTIQNDYDIICNSIVNAILTKNQSSQKIKEQIENYSLGISSYGLIVYIKLETGIFEDDQLEQLIDQTLRLEHLSFLNLVNQSEYTYLINDISTSNLEPLFWKVLDSYANMSSKIISVGISDNYHNYEDIKNKFTEAVKNAQNKLFKSISTITTNKNNKSNYHKTVVEGLNYIAENYQKNISIKTCSMKLLVSESHLMHVFKEDLNKTFNECLTEYRMLIAKNLINQNKYKIYEISDLVGFNDNKYFSQVFKKTYGLTPIEYQDSHYEK